MRKLVYIWLALFASPLYAEDIINSVYLQYREPLDKLIHSSTENKRLSPTKLESYWTLYGNIEGSLVFMRRVKFRIDCQPENWPSKIMISPITVALGDNQERMIKIIWIPPGAEDWYEVNQTFVPEAQVLEACYWLEVRNGR